MGRAWAAWWVVPLLGASLAGCVGGDEAGLAGEAGVADRDEDARITGLVTDVEIVPIPDAQVAVEGREPVTTDAAWRFTVGGLEPGRHRVEVQALGYYPIARFVTLGLGEVADVHFQLEIVPIREPYTELLIHDGYDICSYAALVFVGSAPSPCPLGERKNSFPLDLPDSWRYFVTETVWQGQDSFWVSIAPVGAGCTTGNPCPGVEIGRSPVRIEGAPEDEKLAERYALDGKRTYGAGALNLTVFVAYAGMLREEINNTAPTVCTTFWGQFGVAPRLGCPLGVGYSLGIRFKEYHSIFHWERPEAPGRYTGMPDA